MQDGDVDAMVVQDPYAMGFQGVRLLKAIVEKDTTTQSEILPQLGQPDGDLYDTGLKVVVPNANRQTRLRWATRSMCCR